MWIFYEICYYFDLNDIETKVSERPNINETIFTDKAKLIKFLNFHYNIDDDSPDRITVDQIPTEPGDCIELFWRADNEDDIDYKGYIKKMKIQSCPEDDITIYMPS